MLSTDRECYILLKNHFLHFFVFPIMDARVERRETDKHLVCCNTKCPPIERIRVTFLRDHLGSEVFCGATNGFGHLIWFKLTASAEVNEI